ncbi:MULTISPECIES: LacI family DNA-binding transcriptional regulator [Bacillus]|uniref:LacI family DNA-binding transcriptional regulator n=1 Tax=Bacillus TaxID=1386 RepID=UPI0011A13DF2|nr:MULTISPECIES: LacI family DNA-binding transcriptional regulator [Bacillus]MBU8727885.1 LacI family DNA-binding transcriptional regulator [Bacillus pumilus]MCP1148204.1 LacI family DNA-binding transcriptional regulator [Bacillus sp. 1735sda2]QHQ77206.1 LacI family DNA-binding transcriptional regulator [Bacillus pumilus]
MANIREIAKRAGVSVTTVSRVLNHHPYVKEEKRERVLDAMKELKYTRNIQAVHLAKGYSNMLGIVLPTIDHSYFSRLVTGIAEKAQARGMHFSLFQTGYDPLKEKEALMSLKERRVDGLIFCSNALSDRDISRWQEFGPIIFCHPVPSENCSTVSIAHDQAFKEGLHHLAACGHQRIAIVLARIEGANSQSRLQAYQNMMRSLGQEIDEEWIIEGKLTLFDGKQLFAEWQKMKNRPTALFITNDDVSAGFLLEAQRHDIKVGESPAILGFQNDQLSEALRISSIDIPLKRMGQEAFDLFDQAIKGEAPEKRMLPFRLIERSTTVFKNNSLTHVSSVLYDKRD